MNDFIDIHIPDVDPLSFPIDDTFLTMVELWGFENDNVVADTLAGMTREIPTWSTQSKIYCINNLTSNVILQGIIGSYIDKDLAWCRKNLEDLLNSACIYINSLYLIHQLAVKYGDGIKYNQPNVITDYLKIRNWDPEEDDVIIMHAALVRLIFSYIRYNKPVAKLCSLIRESTLVGFTKLVNSICSGEIHNDERNHSRPNGDFDWDSL